MFRKLTIGAKIYAIMGICLAGLVLVAAVGIINMYRIGTEIEGIVLKGDQRGRLLGYPTANIDLNDYVQPAFGVYAIRAAVAGDDPPLWRDGVANLGIRPMFEVDRPLLEAHLFDFAGDLYGRVLRVQLAAYLRTEIRFRSIDDLITQMNDDSAAARAILAE